MDRMSKNNACFNIKAANTMNRILFSKFITVCLEVCLLFWDLKASQKGIVMTLQSLNPKEAWSYLKNQKY